jgi:hypothetical protein
MILKVKVPVAVAAPVISTVGEFAEFRANPGGKLPLPVAIENEYGGTPPLAEHVNENGVPTVMVNAIELQKIPSCACALGQQKIVSSKISHQFGPGRFSFLKNENGI